METSKKPAFVDVREIDLLVDRNMAYLEHDADDILAKEGEKEIIEAYNAALADISSKEKRFIGNKYVGEQLRIALVLVLISKIADPNLKKVFTRIFLNKVNQAVQLRDVCLGTILNMPETYLSETLHHSNRGHIKGLKKSALTTNEDDLMREDNGCSIKELASLLQNLAADFWRLHIFQNDVLGLAEMNKLIKRIFSENKFLPILKSVFSSRPSEIDAPGYLTYYVEAILVQLGYMRGELARIQKVTDFYSTNRWTFHDKKGGDIGLVKLKEPALIESHRKPVCPNIVEVERQEFRLDVNAVMASLGK